MKCSPFLTWEEAYMHPTEEMTVKKTTGDVYAGVSYFCALVQEGSNLKPYA